MISITWPARRCAFTLVEILVVIGIIVLLAGILVPMIGRAMRQAKQTRTAADMQSIATAIDAFKADHGDIPRLTDPSTGANLPPNLGAAILGRYLNGPLGDGFLPGSTSTTFDDNGPAPAGDPAPHDPAKEYAAGDVVNTGVNRWVALIPNVGVVPAVTTPPTWVQWNGVNDRSDGPGIRMRDGGKKVGPYITSDKMAMRGIAFIDGNGNPILYFPKSTARIDLISSATPVAARTGVYFNSVTNPNPPVTGASKAMIMYDADDNLEAFRRPGEVGFAVVLDRMQAMLGDYNSNGLIETNLKERVVTEAPYLLWAAGTDGKFGPDPTLRDDTAVLDVLDVDECDDVTNFR